MHAHASGTAVRQLMQAAPAVCHSQLHEHQHRPAALIVLFHALSTVQHPGAPQCSGRQGRAPRPVAGV